jgi:hypothetical protein
MPDAVTEQRLPTQRDLLHAPSALWVGCAPAGIAFGASVLESNHLVSLTVAGVLWTMATLWIGIGCVLNARHCGRVHCMIDGVLFPLLSVSGLLNVLGIVTFSWNVYWTAFFVIVVASFVPEFLWRR